MTTRRFLRRLKKLDRGVRDRVLDAVQMISERPYVGSTLVFDERRLYKFRVGEYRLIYEVDEEGRRVLFLVVDHRRRVYREFRAGGGGRRGVRRRWCYGSCFVASPDVVDVGFIGVVICNCARALYVHVLPGPDDGSSLTVNRVTLVQFTG